MEITLNNLKQNSVNNGTRLAVKTAEPIVWKGVQGCENFTAPVSVKEAVEAIGADFEVTKQHLVRVPDNLIQSIMDGNPNVGVTLTRDMIIESHMATVRTDRDITLGVVGSRYGVVQNSKAFEFIDLLASGLEGHDRAVIETAGILGNGERMYVSAKLPSDIYLNDNGTDPINDYILFTNTHDGSGAVTVLFTPIRVICQNTLNMALKMAKNKLIYKHTLNVNSRLEFTKEENIKFALKVLDSHKKFKDTFKDKLLYLNSQKVSDNDVTMFASSVVLGDKRQNVLQDIKKADYNLERVDTISNTIKKRIVGLKTVIEDGIGQDMYRGTKLWLLNGLTTYFSNEKKYKSSEDKFDSIMEGTDLKKLDDAMLYLLTA